MIRAYIGLGSNLDNPATRIRQAVVSLGTLTSTQLAGISQLYISAPIGPADQPDFINAVVAIDTGLEAKTLLKELQALENAAGRERRRHWGERTLDLDILLFGDAIIESADLTIPHPELANRAFVLHPLAELAPELVLPNGRTLPDLLPAVSQQSIRLLD